MKIVILYDSMYGNTEKVADVVRKAFSSSDSVKKIRMTEAKSTDIQGIDLLIVGTPVHGGRPSQATLAFLDSLKESSLSGVKVAAFDTRMSAVDQGFGLKLLMKMIGYAAPRLADLLVAKGGILISPPEGFIVDGKEGPVRNGELERAKSWAHTFH